MKNKVAVRKKVPLTFTKLLEKVETQFSASERVHIKELQKLVEYLLG
jgi:hypothetical protein